MTRPIKWRRLRVVGWAVLALTVSACALLWYLKMRSLYCGHAVLVVGAASLKFFQLHGIAPGDVQDVVNDGLLVVEANGAYTLRQLGPYRAPGDFVRRLRLQFPRSIDGLALDGVRLVNVASGREILVVALERGSLSGEALGWARFVSRAWYNLAAARPTGWDFLDNMSTSSPVGEVGGRR